MILARWDWDPEKGDGKQQIFQRNIPPSLFKIQTSAVDHEGNKYQDSFTNQQFCRLGEVLDLAIEMIEEVHRECREHGGMASGNWSVWLLRRGGFADTAARKKKRKKRKGK